MVRLWVDELRISEGIPMLQIETIHAVKQQPPGTKEQRPLMRILPVHHRIRLYFLLPQGFHSLNQAAAHPARRVINRLRLELHQARNPGKDSVYDCAAVTLSPLNSPRCTIRVNNLISKDRKSTRLNSSHVAISYAVF